MLFHQFILLIAILLLCLCSDCNAASNNLVLSDNSSEKKEKERRDVSIKLVSHEFHGGNLKNQLVLDVSSSTLAHVNWHESYRLQIVTGEHILCDSPMSQLVNGKFHCMLDNHLLVPGDNVFSVVIYSAETHQIYFEKLTHFYFDGAEDLHQISNTVWHWYDLIDTSPKRVILAAAIALIGSSIYKSYAAVSKKPKSPPLPFIPPPRPFSRPKPPHPSQSPPSPPKSDSKWPNSFLNFYFPYGYGAYRFIMNNSTRKVENRTTITKPSTVLSSISTIGSNSSVISINNTSKEIKGLLIKAGTVFLIIAALSITRPVITKGISVITGFIPMLFRRRKPSEKEKKEQISNEIVLTTPVPVRKESQIDIEMRKLMMSSQRFAEWLGTAVLFTNTGSPYFLETIRKYLFPDDSSSTEL